MASDDLYPFAAAVRTYPLGTDIAGSTSLDLGLSVATGRAALADRIIRRLRTPRGGLWYAPDYGYALDDLIGSTVPASIVEQRVLEQVRAEEEVDDARVEAAIVDGRISVTIEAEVADGPFELVLTAAELTFTALLNDALLETA